MMLGGCWCWDAQRPSPCLHFQSSPLQVNRKMFEQESFCSKIEDNFHDLPALRRARTHPAVLFNLRSAMLIKAKLQDAVRALAPSEHTPEGFSKCVTTLLEPVQEGHCRARGE